jgi:Prolyl oligopeptidase family
MDVDSVASWREFDVLVSKRLTRYARWNGRAFGRGALPGMDDRRSSTPGAGEAQTMVIAAFDARAARALRVSLDQSLSTFAALQRRGIESQLLYFPDENHWALKPQNSLQWRDTVHAWMKKYIGP